VPREDQRIIISRPVFFSKWQEKMRVRTPFSVKSCATQQHPFEEDKNPFCFIRYSCFIAFDYSLQ
jgi:hypothetical protein